MQDVISGGMHRDSAGRRESARALSAPSRRIVAIDAFRGLVLVILIPNVIGGFAFFQVAKEFPDSALWTSLGEEFRHVPWRGTTIWDLIMPAFLFAAAAAMPFSMAARRARGATERELAAHMLLRAALLFTLGLLVKTPMDGWTRQVWPLLLLSAGLPIAAPLVRLAGTKELWVERAWPIAVLLVCAVYVALNIEAIGNYQFDGIFSQLALASPFAFLLVGKTPRTQIAAVAAILVGYWLLFALWPIATEPGPGAILPEDTFTGFFAHWSKNANAAFAFERWFFNLLPRAEPFDYNAMGLMSLNFIPSVATMIFGVMAGEWIRSGRSGTMVRNGLLAGGFAGIALGLAAGYTVCPIVKSIWTPSFALFSAGIVTVVLALLYQLCDLWGRTAVVWPLVVLGTNSILVYTLASCARWRFSTLPERLTGFDPFTGPYGPMWESLWVGVTLWCVAFALYRLSIFVRI